MYSPFVVVAAGALMRHPFDSNRILSYEVIRRNLSNQLADVRYCGRRLARIGAK